MMGRTEAVERITAGALVGLYSAARARSAAGALVLLHGRGADEHDLVPLLDGLDPAGRWARVTLRGPLSLPPGGAHWYVVREIGHPDPATFRSTFAILAGALDDVASLTGVARERMVVGGFSQGAVMSYAVGLAEGQPVPAGVLALSGFVPSVPGFRLDLEGRKRLPVFVAHGMQDPVISVEFGRAARDQLGQAGLAVEYHEARAGHYVSHEVTRRARGWLEGLPGAVRKTAGEGGADA